MQDPYFLYNDLLNQEIKYYQDQGFFTTVYHHKLLVSTAPLNITRQNEIVPCSRRGAVFCGSLSVLDKWHDSYYKLHTTRDYEIHKKINCASFCSNHAFLDFGLLISAYNSKLNYENKISLYGLDSLTSYDSFNFKELKFLFDYLESLFPQLTLCVKNLSNSKRQKKIRLQDNISLLVEYSFQSFGGFGSPYYFITLTLPQEYLNTHSLDQVKENLKNFVFTYLGLSISNFDFGLDPLKTHRIHLHVLAAGVAPCIYDFNKHSLDYKKLYALFRASFGSNAIMNCEKGFYDSSENVLACYVSKFSSHALKDSSKLFRSIYSPSFRLLRRGCRTISINSDRNDYYDLLIDLFESYDLNNYPNWHDLISKKNKKYFNNSYRVDVLKRINS